MEQGGLEAVGFFKGAALARRFHQFDAVQRHRRLIRAGFQQAELHRSQRAIKRGAERPVNGAARPQHQIKQGFVLVGRGAGVRQNVCLNRVQVVVQGLGEGGVDAVGGGQLVEGAGQLEQDHLLLCALVGFLGFGAGAGGKLPGHHRDREKDD